MGMRGILSGFFSWTASAMRLVLSLYRRSTSLVGNGIGGLHHASKFSWTFVLVSMLSLLSGCWLRLPRRHDFFGKFHRGHCVDSVCVGACILPYVVIHVSSADDDLHLVFEARLLYCL